MIIDNRLPTAKLRIVFILLLFTPITLGVYIYAIYPSFSISLVVLTILLVITYIVLHFLGFYYVFFSDKGNKITIRYYYAHPFLRKFKALEIPKGMLADAIITSSFFKLKHSLHLVQRTRKGDFEYPPISLSLVNKKMRTQIQKALAEELKASRVRRKN